MTDQLEPFEEPTPDELAEIESFLARADADGSLWSELPAGLEDSIVASIASERDRSTLGRDASDTEATGDRAEPDPAAPEAPPAPISLDRARRRRAPVTWWLSAAAAVVVVLAGVALFNRSSPSDEVAFVMTGTERAPDATADVRVSARPAGLKILLDTTDLPGAPEGTFYEAWLGNGEIRVSAGTFHNRGGSGEIELWAGVVGPEFNQLSVTLEPIDGDAASSGDAWLRGTFDLDE